MAAPDQRRTAIVAVVLLGAMALAVGVVSASSHPAPDPFRRVRDLVHKYYQEQYQLDGGKLDRYVTGSDAAGLALGVYRTRDLPIYRYFQGIGAPRRLIADRFFQGAFGGSFLNHQWLVAAHTPE